LIAIRAAFGSMAAWRSKRRLGGLLGASWGALEDREGRDRLDFSARTPRSKMLLVKVHRQAG